MFLGKASVPVYIISYSWYEDYSPIYLESNKVYKFEDLEALTDSLVGEAASRVLVNHHSESVSVGWADIVQELAELLIEKHGFSRIKLQEISYWGSNIITCVEDSQKDKADLIPQKVLEYNQHIELLSSENVVLSFLEKEDRI